MAKDRTYTFRARADLGERLEAVRGLFGMPDDEDVEVAGLVARELARRLHRARTSGLELATQSDVLRLALELVVGSCEKVAADVESADLYAQEPLRDDENEEWLAAVFASVERRSVT